MSDTQSRFAYGDDYVQGFDCPAVATGDYHSAADDYHVGELAEKYDDMVESRTGDIMGVVDAETAEEAWNEAIEYFKQLIEETRSPAARDDYRQIVAKGEKIAEQVF